MPPEITASRLSRAEQVREKRIKLGGWFKILRRCQGPRRPQMSVAPDGTLVKARVGVAVAADAR
jgi:hypothetical protein